MRVSKQIKLVVFAALMSVGAGIFVFNVDAQTSKRKKTAKPTATPRPMLTDAEIISRAADLQENPTLVVTPPKDEPVTAPTDNTAARVKELSARVKKLETPKTDNDDKQKRLLLNLDILSRSEQRSESLRKNLFEMIEKENAVKSRLDQIENDIRPEMIERSLQLSGSMRPEEIRDIRKKSLAAERANLQALLTEIQSTRANLSVSVQRADELVVKLRIKLEKEIEDSLKDDPEN